MKKSQYTKSSLYKSHNSIVALIADCSSGKSSLIANLQHGCTDARTEHKINNVVNTVQHMNTYTGTHTHKHIQGETAAMAFGP